MLVSLLLTTALAGDTLTVPGDFATLQLAYAARQPGDVIQLADGTHTLNINNAGVGDLAITGASHNTVVRLTNREIRSDGRVELVDLTLRAPAGRQAVRCQSGGTLIALRAVVEGATVDNGGTLRTQGCQVALHDTIVRFGASDVGAQIAADDSNLTLLRSTIVGGTATRGGAIHQTGGELLVARGSISGGVASETGGGLHLEGTRAHFDGAIIGNNLATSNGGGIYAEGSSELRLSGSQLAANVSDGVGGGLYDGGGADVLIERSTVSGNRAMAVGGLRCLESASCEVAGSIFRDNTAGIAGAMSLGDGAIASGNAFCFNRATAQNFASGGALYIDGVNVVADHNLYVDNSAAYAGGAAFVLGGSVTLDHETFVFNAAGNRGSATYVQGGSLALRNSIVQGNTGSVAASNERFLILPVGGLAITATSFFDNPAGHSSLLLLGNNRVEDSRLATPNLRTCASPPYFLQANSPAIDSGVGTNDPDGSLPDRGAFPFGGFSDIDGDGIPVGLDCDDTNGNVGAATMVFPDTDGDGFGGLFADGIGCPTATLVTTSGDCDDSTDLVAPNRVEVAATGIDEDCDGTIDVVPAVWYTDADGDGFGDPNLPSTLPVQPPGTVTNPDDCDDTDDQVNPQAAERCAPAGIDDDCDGLIDDADPDATGRIGFFTDDDGDTFTGTFGEACVVPPGSTPTPEDCDDTDLAINPDADEICDTIDNDCDVQIDDDDDDVVGAPIWYLDNDGDTYFGSPVSACEAPPDSSPTETDCDDLNPDRNSGEVEVCNGIDDDCDGLVDTQDDDFVPLQWFVDTDGDGFAGTRVEGCSPPANAPTVSADCDETDEAVNAGAIEICNGIDDDCDGDLDDADDNVVVSTPFFLDADRDGFGAGEPFLSCIVPGDVADNNDDCDDGDPDIHPGADEICNGVDDNCDERIDDADPLVIGQSPGFFDGDGDGFAGTPGLTCTPLVDQDDCDDDEPAVNPGADEVCDGIDNNCDGLTDDDDDAVVDPLPWYVDLDGDGEAGELVLACAQPPGSQVDSTDCDESEPARNDAATEICDGLDNDCDTFIDDADPEGVDGIDHWVDDDDDGFGTGTPASSCSPPAGSASQGGDCDDTDPGINPDATEVCDGVDNNCDTLIDDADPTVQGLQQGFVDADGDGHPGTAALVCVQNPATDCDDTDPGINPDAIDLPDDDLDQDCSGDALVYSYANGAGCGCSSSPSSAAWFAPGLLLLLRRRRG